jgi:plastocyanin
MFSLWSRSFLSRAAATAAAALLVAGLAASPAWSAEAQVKISNFAFDPPVLTVPAGTTVVWTNQDGDVHVVSEQNGKFRSMALDTGDTFSQTFTAAGTINYFCAVHPQMTGKIVVTP